MEQNNKFTISGATMGNNTLLSLSAALLVTTLVSFTGEQTLYTPNEEALHMHIYCTSQWMTGERNICIGSSTQAIGGGESYGS